ncbi:MAG: hypothetical protein KOO62_06330 [candidate division Zixibacteria bacterium]|nr:hypothetical protein [candidate division Zixibacteria bacterium]
MRSLFISFLTIIALLAVGVAGTTANPLRLMTTAEQENAEINLILDDTENYPIEASDLVKQFETLWNSGSYEPALDLFDQLTTLVGMENIDVVTRYRTHITTVQPGGRYTEVNFCPYDSVYDVELCVSSEDPNILFASVLHEGDGYVCQLKMFFSVDGGSSWDLTSSLGSGGWHESISMTYINGYCYVAKQTSSNRLRLFRYSNSDGSLVDFPEAGTYVTIAAVDLKEMVISTDEDAQPYLSVFGMNSDGDLFLGTGFEPFDVSDWGSGFLPEVDDISHGLDGLYTVGGTYDRLISYYSESDQLKLVSYSMLPPGWTVQKTWDMYNISSSWVTSLSSYGNSIACVADVFRLSTGLSECVVATNRLGYFESAYFMTPYYNTDSIKTYTPAIDMRGGGAVGVCYFMYNSSAGMWSERFAIAPFDDLEDVETLRDRPQMSYTDLYMNQDIRPDLSYIGSSNFGIVWVAGHTNDKGYFTRMGCCVPPIRGNVDYELPDEINIADLTYLVSYLFTGGSEPPCMEEADINGDGEINIADLTYLVSYLFTGGPPPVSCP